MSFCQLASEDNRVDSSFIGPRMGTGAVWCPDLSWIRKLLAVGSFQVHRRTKGFFNFHCTHVEQQFVNKKTFDGEPGMNDHTRTQTSITKNAQLRLWRKLHQLPESQGKGMQKAGTGKSACIAAMRT